MNKALLGFCIVGLLTVGMTTLCAREDRPNIVFFLADDLGWRDLACFGSTFYETPNLDRLAAEGTKFSQAYASCHVCSPTRASLLTGRSPARLQITDWLPGRKDHPSQMLIQPTIKNALPASETTLAEELKKHGYSTAIYGKWHVGEGESIPENHGFDKHIPSDWNKGWPKVGYHHPIGMAGLPSKPGDYLTDRLTDEALKYIEDHKDTPFFLYLSHFAVHDPIQGRQDLVAKYSRKLSSMPKATGPEYLLEGNPDDPKPLTRGQLDQMIHEPEYQGYRVLPNRTVKIKQHQDNVQFAAMVESVDESMGRIMAKLKELGIDDNTIIIFTSDNGGMSAANFGNPKRIVTEDKRDLAFSTSNVPLRGGKGWMYEGGIRVPAIVKWPQKGKQGIVCEEPIITADYYPTILEMVGLSLQPGQHADGKSFAAALKGETFERGALYWHFPHYSNHGMQSPCGAIRQGDYKLIEYFENGTVQLFNLKNDPGEHNDLAASQPDTADMLLKKLQSWRRELNAQMPVKR